MHTRRRTRLREGIAVIGLLLAALLVPQSAALAQDGVVSVVESEPMNRTGVNDERASGELIDAFGTGIGDAPLALISGNLADPGPGRPVTSDGEDDGSIDLATVLDVTSGDVVAINGMVGDGPHVATGDFDHYGVFLDPGQTLSAIASPAADSGLDPVVYVYDETGDLVAENDDSEPGTDAALVVVDGADGGFYTVSVGGCCLPQADPFDSASGAGAASTGEYQLSIGVDIEVAGSALPVLSEEPDNTILEANVLELTSPGSVLAVGEIENTIDGAFGDADFWALGFLAEGERITLDVDTDGELDSFILLFDEAGDIVDGNDDDGITLDSFLSTTAPQDGEYFVAVLACCSEVDPFDAEVVAPGFGGVYTMLIQRGIDPIEEQSDRDVYLIELEVGDVMSAAFAGAVDAVEILDPAGVLRMGSGDNVSFIYPVDSPLRHQGHAGIDHVAGRAGTHAIVVSGAGGRYRGELRVARASTEHQIVFLDFDGATINPQDFGSPFGPAQTSPLSSFLFRWDLGPESENAVIDAIVANVRENFEVIAGIPTGIEVLNSRDHLDPGDLPGMTRMVVGGSSYETTVSALGVAQSIDPGNLDRDETGLVMLDALSERVEFGLLNDITLGPDVTKVQLVGEGVGNIVSHELGHLFGLLHTSDFNKIQSLMDTGGAPLVVVGPDGIFGTADDTDVDFLIDEFNEFEGFFGYQDVISRLLVGLGASELIGEQQVLPGTDIPEDPDGIPTIGEPIANEPAVEEPVVEEPVTEPVVDEPIADEPPVEEPPAIDKPPVVDQPVAPVPPRAVNE